jgi:PPM family protein phosphatase
VCALFSVALSSAIGRREQNEDRCGERQSSNGRHAWAVADGLGGHEGGEVAAQVALDAALDRFAEADNYVDLGDVVHISLEQARDAVSDARERSDIGSDMATTFALVVSDGEAIAWGHVGDTRIYRVREGRAAVLTRDHTLAASMRALAGAAQEHDLLPVHTNVLASSLGPKEPFIEVSEVEPLLQGDVFLICSDGLWAHFSEAALEQDLARSRDLGEWLARLERRVEEARDPEQDNYTAIAFCAVPP